MTKKDIARFTDLASRVDAAIRDGKQSLDIWRGDMRAILAAAKYVVSRVPSAPQERP